MIGFERVPHAHHGTEARAGKKFGEHGDRNRARLYLNSTRVKLPV
jgi:hypothetical protein